MLYYGNGERVFPHCIQIPSIDGLETFRQFREKLLKEFPELTPENYFTFSPAEMTAKVRSFGNTTPRSSLSHEALQKSNEDWLCGSQANWYAGLYIIKDSQIHIL